MVTTSVALGPAGALTAADGECGQGLYLLTGAREQLGPSGQTRLQLALEDATGRITGVVWPESRPSVVCPATLPAPVAVHATVQHFDNRPQVKVQSLTAVPVGEVTRATALLPHSRCPEVAWPALERITRLERELPAPLDGFLREVLLDPQVTLPFLGCRASVAHHHAYPGGLLVHSTEMLDTAYDLTHRILPRDAWSPCLAQLGYLLHDLGKLRTVGEVRRPQYGLVVRHEQMTIEILAPHLRWLELRNPDLAAALRYLFGYLATPAAARKPPEHVMTEVVATLDQWSAATHNHRDLDHLLRKSAASTPIARSASVRHADRHQPHVRYG